MERAIKLLDTKVRNSYCIIANKLKKSSSLATTVTFYKKDDYIL